MRTPAVNARMIKQRIMMITSSLITSPLLLCMLGIAFLHLRPEPDSRLHLPAMHPVSTLSTSLQSGLLLSNCVECSSSPTILLTTFNLCFASSFSFSVVNSSTPSLPSSSSKLNKLHAFLEGSWFPNLQDSSMCQFGEDTNLCPAFVGAKATSLTSA